MFGFFIAAAYLWRSHSYFTNEYGVPDGAILFYLSCIATLPTAGLLVLYALAFWAGPSDALRDRTIVTAAIPLLLPSAMLLLSAVSRLIGQL